MIDSDKVKKILEDILKKMNVEYEVIEVGVSEITSSPRFLVKSRDSAMLIGAKGANLLALNHVIKRMIGKDETEEESPRFFIDVNDYHEKLEEDLKNKAKIMSERARSFKVDVELEPMSSYERMIVHAFLQGAKDIKTESKGDGKFRRVVIKYTEA